MTQTNNLTVKPFNSATLIKNMLIGGTIGLVIMAIFLFGVDETKAEWGKYWMIKPYVIMTLGSAAGGACFYFLDLFFGYQSGWKKAAIIVVGVIGFIISLFLSFVLGLDGTLWN